MLGKKPQPPTFKDLTGGEVFRWADPNDPPGLHMRTTYGTECISLASGQLYSCDISDLDDPVIRVSGRIIVVAAEVV